MTDDEVRASLAAHIAARRVDLGVFLRQHRPRNHRRTTVTIVLTSLAALATAGPAVGGDSFSGGVQRALGLSSDTTVWRTLCLVALLLSAGAAVMAGLGKSDDTAQIAAAETVDCELEGLLTLLEFGHLSTDDAVKLYQQYTVKVPFVEATAPVFPATRGPASSVPAPHRSASDAPASDARPTPARATRDPGTLDPATRLAALPPLPYPHTPAVPVAQRRPSR